MWLLNQNVVNDDRAIPLEVRYRYRQAAVEGAGRFQSTIPDRTGELDLHNDDYLVNWWWRYGLPQKGLYGKRCTDTCKDFGKGCMFESRHFVSGVHSLLCSAKNLLWRAHQAILSVAEQYVGCVLTGATCSRNGVACHVGNDGQVDCMIDRPTTRASARRST